MGIIERRLREKQRRVEEIVQAAKKIFSAKGFANTTMNDIADSSELSRRTIYMYFKSKEDLSLAVAASALRYLDESFQRIVDSDGTAFDRLNSMLDVYDVLITDDPGQFQFLVAFVDSASAVDTSNEFFQECEKLLGNIVGVVTEQLRAGLVDGSLCFQGDPGKIAAAIIFAIHSIVESSYTYRSALPGLLKSSMESTIEQSLEIVKAFLTQNMEPNPS